MGKRPMKMALPEKQWTESEDVRLNNLVRIFRMLWGSISSALNRTPDQCLSRYKKLHPYSNSGETVISETVIRDDLEVNRSENLKKYTSETRARRPHFSRPRKRINLTAVNIPPLRIPPPGFYDTTTDEEIRPPTEEIAKSKAAGRRVNDHASETGVNDHASETGASSSGTKGASTRARRPHFSTPRKRINLTATAPGFYDNEDIHPAEEIAGRRVNDHTREMEASSSGTKGASTRAQRPHKRINLTAVDIPPGFYERTTNEDEEIARRIKGNTNQMEASSSGTKGASTRS